jgi:glutathione S-transferase
MKLVGSKTSPYVRKVRVILAERNLPFEFVEESAWNADTTVPRYNPLNKVPALVMDDGESIYDSRVICEYLDAVSGAGLLPADPAQRARVRR